MVSTMALDNKLRIKCYLGNNPPEIRSIITHKEVSEDELLHLIEQEYGRPIIVREYEDHEQEKVSIRSANGLHAALTEHMELSHGALKLYLQYKPDESYPLSPSKSTSNINVSGISVISNGSSNGSNASGWMNGHGPNGVNGYLGNPRRNSSNYSISTTDSISSSSSNNIHVHPHYKMELDGSQNLEAPPPMRTPPPTPPDSPRYLNEIRTPPQTPPDSPSHTHSPRHADKGRNEGNEDGNPHHNFPKKILHIDTDSNSTSTSSPRHHHNRPLSPNHFLHHDQDNLDTNGTTRSNNTPPIRTPPPSPRPHNHNPAPHNPAPHTPPSTPPSPTWVPSPVIATRNPQPPALMAIAEQPQFQPHSPNVNFIPFPSPFRPKSPRSSPKLPPSILQQSEHEEEQNVVIKWEKGPVIGRGGFGCVYMGMCDNGELIAVKQLELDDNEDPKSKATIQSFAQEIGVMKTLRHENIVRYLGVQIEDEYLNILLEYVPSGSISYLLGKFSKFPEPAIRVYTKQILQGLAYLHANNIVHRDVKGANILVDKNGTVKLADFGCSKIFAGLKSQLKTVLGTPFWMAPEVIKQSGYGRSADIWSLGCVIIEMATGQPPWQNQFQEVTAAMFHIASTDAVPEMPPNLSPEAHDFLSLCFKRVPTHRPKAETLLKHPFLQDVASTKDSLGRRNSFGGPNHSPVNLTVQVTKTHNRAPSISTPPVPLSPFSLSEIFPSTALSSKYHKLDMLPTSLVLCIFRLLPPEIQATVRLVCKAFAKVIKEEIWQQLKRTKSITNGSNSDRKAWAEDKITITTFKFHTKPVHCLALGDSVVASGGEDKKIKVWDVKKAKRLVSLQGHTSTVTGVCMDKNNSVFSASADMSIKIWTPFKTATPKKTTATTLTGHTQPLTGIALMDSGTKLVSSSYDKSLRIWDIVKGVPLSTLNGHDGAVLGVTWSQEGQVIISASSDQSLKVWDIRVNSGNSIVKTLTGHVGEVKCCYFANNRLVSGGDDKQVRVWDLATSKSIRKFDHAHPVTSVACDQSKVVSSGDKVVKLWEWEKDGELLVKDLKTTIFCVATDDTRVYAGGHDKSIRILSQEIPGVSTPRPFFARLLG